MGSIIVMLPTIIGGITSLVNFIGTIRSAAQQSGDWTPELEKQFQDMLLATASDPAWQPDKK